jgi:uncharacterized protein YqjF (DUF2071 family)
VTCTGRPEPVSATAPALPRPHWLRQDWCDVGFVHWAVRPDAVAWMFPPGTRPDVFDGWTYVGLVPFRMERGGPAMGPPLPWLGSFLETNVRLYSVDVTGRRGTVFLSMDAQRAAVVAAARVAFGLPYRHARMRFRADGDVRGYAARVRWPGVSAESRVRLRLGDRLRDGPLERFLTARWGLHVRHLDRTWYLPNAHPPWPLRSAELLECRDGLVGSVGLGDLGRPDHVMFSDGVRAVFGRPVLATTRRCE